MTFPEAGNPAHPTIILLHGGGLSSWSFDEVAQGLQPEYHVVTPIIDGHGGNDGSQFISIENSAQKLIAYIDQKYKGKVFALGGLSIGAQIATEVLSQRGDIADYAVLESALVYPIKGTKAFSAALCRLFYGFIRRRWFSRLQARVLFVPTEMFERYYQDSLAISKQSLINLTVSNGSYSLKHSVSAVRAKTLILVGEKELGIMKKSAVRLHHAIKGSTLYVAPSMGHGELSLVHTAEFIKCLKDFFSD
jgi:pimeloyl-ACP methyl ester carboxylesterase